MPVQPDNNKKDNSVNIISAALSKADKFLSVLAKPSPSCDLATVHCLNNNCTTTVTTLISAIKLQSKQYLLVLMPWKIYVRVMEINT